MSAAVFAFEVRCPRLGGGGSVINHRTRGGAAAEYLRDLRDAWPDARFTDLRVRKLGPPETSAAFLRVAARRGMPGVRCGDRVLYRDDARRIPGCIVGHNDSDNFDVLFDVDTPFRGAVGNVHPLDLELTP